MSIKSMGNMSTPTRKQHHLISELCSFILLINVSLFLFSDLTWAAEKHADKQSKDHQTIGKSNKVNGQEKSRDHLNKAFRQHQNTVSSKPNKEVFVSQTLERLLEIYKASIKPLEDAYRFVDLNKDALLEAEIAAKPLVLFVGPWSTGKTTFINYLLNIEDKSEKLHTGAEPTTTDFFVLQNGSRYRMMTGMQLVSDRSKAFASLEKYGQGFIQRLQGMELKSDLLQYITLVDTPGIIENKKQQERGYPFSEIVQWFLQRASLIFLVFDPSKLEVGSELEILFNQLKGYESKVKIILNKADTINSHELMKVYGALFWNLAPLIHSVEPPRVYIGSFWSKSKTDHPMTALFLEEEQTLIQDIYHVIENWVENKIVYVQRHAFKVRLHAFAVDSFIQVYTKSKGIFTNPDVLWNEIVNQPEKYGVFHDLLKQRDISIHDLPAAKTYIKFFSQNKLSYFSPLESYCPQFFNVFGKCDSDKIENAMQVELPLLFNVFKELSLNHCTKNTCS